MLRNFKKDLEMSKRARIKIDKCLHEIYDNIKKIEHIDTTTDDGGIDCVVHLFSGQKINVDYKILTPPDTVPLDKIKLVVERWANIGRQTPGWTVDPNKQTDIVLWYVPRTDRYYSYSFKVLYQLFSQKDAWDYFFISGNIKEWVQHTGNYSSCSYFISPEVLDKLIKDMGQGVIPEDYYFKKQVVDAI
jgi:hypothetical protein